MLTQRKWVPGISRSPYALAMKLDLACRLLEMPAETRQALRTGTADIVRVLGELEADVSARPIGRARIATLLQTGVGRLKDCRSLLNQALHESDEVNHVIHELERFFASAMAHAGA